MIDYAMDADYLINRIPTVFPNQRVSVITTQYGNAVKVEGKGARATANYFTRERWFFGSTDTNWRDVRHGLGYLIPLYENPVDAIM
jgi:hypothetical protein